MGWSDRLGKFPDSSKTRDRTVFQTAELSEELYTSYCSRLQELGVLDFDDLLLEAQKQNIDRQKQFTYLLVDEFQYINDIQYQLVQKWNKNGKYDFTINQNIYSEHYPLAIKLTLYYYSNTTTK